MASGGKVHLEEIVSEIQNLIDNPPSESFVEKTLAETIYVGLNVLNKTPLLEFVKANCETDGKTLYCQHLTQVYLGRKNNSPVKVVKSGSNCLVTVDALVVNKVNGSAAFRISNVVTEDGENVEIANGKPHITALVSSDSKPVDSIKFVSKEDDSVIIIPFQNVVETICVWN